MIFKKLELDFKTYTEDEKYEIIAKRELFKKFLKILLTTTIACKVRTREDIEICRTMEEFGVQQIANLVEEYEKNQRKE